jgi:hypothetical protein
MLLTAGTHPRVGTALLCVCVHIDEALFCARLLDPDEEGP